MPKIIDTVATDTIVELTNGHGVDVGGVKLINQQVATDTIIEATSGHGVDVGGVNLKGNRVSAQYLTVSDITAPGWVLQSDIYGNATWTSKYVTPVTVTAATANEYFMEQDVLHSVYLFSPDANWVVYLPSIEPGRHWHICNCSTQYSLNVNSGPGETIWDAVRTSVIVPPNSKLALIGGNTNVPRWFAV